MYQEDSHRREPLHAAPKMTVRTLSQRSTEGWAEIAGRRFRCALGRGGLGVFKREGDGKSPVGVWPLRHMFYRPDRIPLPPRSGLEIYPVERDDGWCDDPADRRYNQLVPLPYPASAEHLWRDDHLYDIVVVLGHNDDPPVRGMGSAIFMHLAKPGYQPTEGCIALNKRGLLQVVELLGPDSFIEISA